MKNYGKFCEELERIYHRKNVKFPLVWLLPQCKILQFLILRNTA